MAATVIDQLIVKLGLDPSDFTKGGKQAVTSVLKTKDVVKKSTNEMGADFVSFTKKLLGVGTAIMLLKKLVGAMAEVSTQTRRLGIDASNFRISANELRNWQNAAELMGGKAEDVTATVEGLQKSIYDLTVNGSRSPQVEMLARLGVQFQDATGHARKFEDVVLDTADALEQAQKNGTFNRTEAYFAAKQAGFDEGTTQLILSGRGNINKELAGRRDLHQVNGQDIAAATSIERGRAKASQFVEAGAVAGLGIAGQAGENVKAAYDTAVMKTTDAMVALAAATENVAGNLSNAGTRGMSLAQRKAKYSPTVKRAAAKYGIPEETLDGLLNTESRYNPDAVSPAGAVGIAQFMPKTATSRGFTAGKDAHRDIIEAAKFLKELHDSFVKSGDADDDGAWFLATQAYNAGETRVRNSRKVGGKPLAQETLDYPGKVLGMANAAVASPAAAARAGTTTVNVGGVTVHTAATDANGLARDMNGAVQRKMNLAQAETGVQ